MYRLNGGVSLGSLLGRLGNQSLRLVSAPRGTDVELKSVAIFDVSDGPGRPNSAAADVLIALGPVDSSPALLFDTAQPFPKVIFLRERCVTPTVELMAKNAGVALVAASPDTPWEQIHSDINRLLDMPSAADDAFAGDLYDLVEALAGTTGGIAAIEDENCRNLAYSSNSQHADSAWKKSVLRRVAPGRNLDLLREWGVLEALETSEKVVEVAGDPSAGRRRRLASAMHSSGSWIGAVWLQEMPGKPLAEDAADVLLSTSQIASRIVERSRNRWTSLRREMHAVLGFSPMDVADQASLLARLDGTGDKSAVLIALATFTRHNIPAPVDLHKPTAGEIPDPPAPPPENVVAIRATQLWASHLALSAGNRIYIAIPAAEQEERKTTVMKAQKLISTLESKDGVVCVAAVGSPTPKFLSLATTRPSVDRALDVLNLGDSPRAATVESLEQQISMRALLGHLVEDPLWSCSKIARLLDYDEVHNSELSATLRTYLECAGSIAKVAEKTHLHTNTVRYRIARATEITAIDLDDPLDRVTCLLDLWGRQIKPSIG